MEILLPKRNDNAQTEKLSSRTVTVVGANGAGKSRFGVEIARRIQDHAFWLSAQKALCIMPPHEVWPGSIEAMYQEFMEYSYYVSKDTPTVRDDSFSVCALSFLFGSNISIVALFNMKGNPFSKITIFGNKRHNNPNNFRIFDFVYL